MASASPRGGSSCEASGARENSSSTRYLPLPLTFRKLGSPAGSVTWYAPVSSGRRPLLEPATRNCMFTLSLASNLMTTCVSSSMTGKAYMSLSPASPTRPSQASSCGMREALASSPLGSKSTGATSGPRGVRRNW